MIESDDEAVLSRLSWNDDDVVICGKFEFIEFRGTATTYDMRYYTRGFVSTESRFDGWMVEFFIESCEAKILMPFKSFDGILFKQMYEFGDWESLTDEQKQTIKKLIPQNLWDDNE